MILLAVNYVLFFDYVFFVLVNVLMDNKIFFVINLGRLDGRGYLYKLGVVCNNGENDINNYILFKKMILNIC